MIIRLPHEEYSGYLWELMGGDIIPTLFALKDANYLHAMRQPRKNFQFTLDGVIILRYNVIENGRIISLNNFGCFLKKLRIMRPSGSWNKLTFVSRTFICCICKLFALYNRIVCEQKQFCFCFIPMRKKGVYNGKKNI